MSCIKICTRCNKEYVARSGVSKYCDECRMILSICPVCGGQKDIYHKFCSLSCAGKWNYQHSEKVREALRQGIYHPNRAKGISKALKGKPRPCMRKENNPAWKGGSSLLRHREMGRIEYKLWRAKVFERDGYKCQNCGKVGGKLNAHHIKPWADYPELRYDIDNGITLCKECHLIAHAVRGEQDNASFKQKSAEGCCYGFSS